MWSAFLCCHLSTLRGDIENLKKYQNIKFQMIKCLAMEYKRSTFQLGLQARNVNKSEKNHKNGS